MSTCNNITLAGLGRLEACKTNLSGVKTMWIIPASDVESINAQRATQITDLDGFCTIGSAQIEGKAITCKEGKGFVKVFCADDMGELKYTSQGNMVGARSFKASLEIYNPGFRRRQLGFLSYFNNQDAIIVVLLNNGEYHLLGDTFRGALLASGNEASSGKESTADNGINPVFEYNTGFAQIFWEGFDPTDEEHGIDIIDESAA